jgi:hypothetical protein
VGSLIPIQYRLAALAAVVLAAFATGWLKGHGRAMRAWEAAQAEQERIALRAALTMERRGAEEVVRYVTRTKEIHVAIQAVPAAVTPQDDARCALPPGFDRVWNAVNRASAPDAAGALDAPADAPVQPGADAHR